MSLPNKNSSQPTKTLTNREVEVLNWVANGKTRSEISIILGISPETVKAHLENSCRKLNAVNKTQAVTIALVSALINPRPKNQQS